jgi:hypothetical protein
MRQLWRTQRRKCCIGETGISLGKVEEGADGRKLPGQAAAFHADFPPPGHETAEIHNRQGRKIRHSGGLSQMVFEELPKLRNIAGIGFQRFGRHAALGLQRLQPAHGNLCRIARKPELKTITHALA